MTGPSWTALRRILVVDDEELIRHVVGRALPSYQVIEAGDAEEALERMVEAPADMIITDIKLRHMDGCALAANVQERWPGVPLVAISGYVNDRDVADFDFVGFLEKPLDLEALRAMVDRVLSLPRD